MVTAGIVFIHPNDMTKMLNRDPFIIDLVIREWYDGWPVKEINGVVYRETILVPEVLEMD
jgi:hypothetical protein